MSKPYISIIVPVYNCETYITRCLNSIVNQTLKSIEIIVINDGSTDNTPYIVNKFAAKYKNIKVVHQNNKGIYKARNKGLSLATGEYVGFVDADDYVDKTMFEKLFLQAKHNKVSLAVCDYNMVYRSDILNNVLNFKPSKIDIKEVGLNIFYLRYILNSPILWNKIFKLDTIKKFNLKFKNNICEDLIFCLEFTSNIDSAVILKDPLYFYVQRKNSIMHKTKALEITKLFFDQFFKNIINNKKLKSLNTDSYYYIFATMFSGLMFSNAWYNQPLSFFISQFKFLRKWDKFDEFCYVISSTSKLKNLYITNALSFKFYSLLKVIFLFCRFKLDLISSFVILIAAKLIYLKSKKRFNDLFD